MPTIVLQMLAWLVFAMGTVTLGAWLRRHPSKRNAEMASRTLHLAFWVGVAPTAGLSVFYPGLAGFDEVLGIPGLPRHPALPLFGILALSLGTYLILVSNVALWLRGHGANAIFLTRQLVTSTIYERMRNPMSLGLYLWAIGTGLLASSAYLTLAALLIAVPVHIFYLKYFEEYELELRLGQPYKEYKRQVPFLLPRLVGRSN
jgi:protein-S-isoprenylcysteine O-methyltransferase Ste14